MRRQAFALTILGLFILLFFFNSKPLPLQSQEQLEQFQPNQKFLIRSQVIKETYTKTNKILHLDNSLSLQCPRPCPSFLNQNITATAILEKYNNNNYLKILEIKYAP
jgi:hypothetical protein